MVRPEVARMPSLRPSDLFSRLSVGRWANRVGGGAAALFAGGTAAVGLAARREDRVEAPVVEDGLRAHFFESDPPPLGRNAQLARDRGIEALRHRTPAENLPAIF